MQITSTRQARAIGVEGRRPTDALPAGWPLVRLAACRLPDSMLRGLLERAHAAGAAQGGGGNGRNAPLIGQVVASNGMSADELAERLWFKTRTRG